MIGQLRLRGLLFVGRAPVENRHYKVAIIPGELREPLLQALKATASSAQAALPAKVSNARYYTAVARQLEELSLVYGTFATEDESLKGYYEKFMSYWRETEYGKDFAVESFAVEEYLWNFRLPGSDEFLLDRFLAQKGKEVPEELKPGLLNHRGAELRCCRILALTGLLLLEDLESGQRMWCFSPTLGGLRNFRGSVGKFVVSQVAPWDDTACCLAGCSAVASAGEGTVRAYRDLKRALRDTTARTRRYFVTSPRRHR